jgi:hypothetical protein
MTRRITDDLELHIGPHGARRGWETVRLHYNAANPSHQQQIQAALAALRRARFGLAHEVSEQDQGVPEIERLRGPASTEHQATPA